MLAVTKYFHHIRRRGVLTHFAENGFQRFQHRLLAAEMQGAHLIPPLVAIEQIDAAYQELLLAEAENVQLTEIEMRHLVAECRGGVMFQINDNRQLTDFTQAIERFGCRYQQREVACDIGDELI